MRRESEWENSTELQDEEEKHKSIFHIKETPSDRVFCSVEDFSYRCRFQSLYIFHRYGVKMNQSTS